MRKILGALIAAAALVVILTPSAPASATSCTTAWRHPGSSTARACRQLGWTITARLAVTPQGVIAFARLPHCAAAATWLRPCGSNLRGQDRSAPSYWVGSNGDRHYVWAHGPRGSWRWPTGREQRRYDLLKARKAQVWRTHDAFVVRFPSRRAIAIVCTTDTGCMRLPVA